MDAAADAPGANDNGSGSAAVIEAARVLCRHRFPATLVFALLSGEEQGLYGGAMLARHARAEGWRVEAVLNNDIIGSSRGPGDASPNRHVRIFAASIVQSSQSEGAARLRRSLGGENDTPARSIARFMQSIARTYLDGFEARIIYRADRLGRGGDHIPMLEAGYPAVRITEAAENYARQHQDVRIEDGVDYGDVLAGLDFGYLAQATRLNVVTMAAMARAPAPPGDVRVEGAVSYAARLSWVRSPGAESYRVHWRDTTAPDWTMREDAAGDSITLDGVIVDDFLFGVSAISNDGYESPIVFPGEDGAFFR